MGADLFGRERVFIFTTSSAGKFIIENRFFDEAKKNYGGQSEDLVAGAGRDFLYFAFFADYLHVTNIAYLVAVCFDID